jgi:predicted anti-sigma-YlaC factor YlaD
VSVEASISCREVVELLSDYLDGALPEPELARIAEHLEGCDGCTMVLDQLRETIRLTGMITVEQLTEAQRTVLLGAFRGWTPRH